MNKKTIFLGIQSPDQAYQLLRQFIRGYDVSYMHKIFHWNAGYNCIFPPSLFSQIDFTPSDDSTFRFVRRLVIRSLINEDNVVIKMQGGDLAVVFRCRLDAA